ncbi:hypothetical protein AbraIFM66951_011100 [Aspergillus brasiliensis]|nr:hypothetical protein AbraIFM66951_011100 [Aspergillus brasiliensis]
MAKPTGKWQAVAFGLQKSSLWLAESTSRMSIDLPGSLGATIDLRRDGHSKRLMDEGRNTGSHFLCTCNSSQWIGLVAQSSKPASRMADLPVYPLPPTGMP